MKPEDLKEAVRERYAKAARSKSSCCSGPDPITTNLYNPEQSGTVPTEALQASLGCGNPTLLAQLQPGETVLDLGSGGGLDVLLSARRVGPTGKAYGLDMTDEMLELARENQRKAGAANVEFLKGDIENIPLPHASVDIVISNCVINLAADKSRVLREAFRVLRPGGRFAVSDIVVRGPIAPEIRRNMELWAGCLAGALEIDAYRRLLAAAGFRDIEIEITREYACGEGGAAVPPATDGKFASAFVRATKGPQPTRAASGTS